MTLSDEELSRYDRQILIDGWGERAQRALGETTVFVAGLGGLGSPVSIYLATAGVGRLVVCDADHVALSNLNRQILHDASRLGDAKASSASTTLTRLNPHVEVVAHEALITEGNVDEVVGDARLIVDCMDNFETRYILNDSAIRKSIPLVHGSVRGLEGRLSFIHVPETACLRCIFPGEPPPGISPTLGAVAGVIGALQATEALKYLAGIATNIKGRLLVWDGAAMDFRSFRTQRDPDCPSCSAVC